MHDVFDCLFPITACPMASTARPSSCSQYLNTGWWPLLRRPIFVCSFHDNFDSSLRSSFFPFTPYTRRIFSFEASHSLVARLIVAFAESYLCLTSSNLVQFQPFHFELPRSDLHTRIRLSGVLHHEGQQGVFECYTRQRS